MLSSTLMFSPIMCNLLLIPSRYFSPQTLSLSSRSSQGIFFFCLPCLYLVFWMYGILLVINVLHLYLLILTFVSLLGKLLLISPLIMGHIFLLLCMPGKFWLGARHSGFYLLGCSIFLYFHNCSWALSWHAMKLLWNSLILSRFVRQN